MFFNIICVVYNTQISHISSLANFIKLKKQHDNVKIIVFDNSEPDFVQDTSTSDIIYYRNITNIGLSKNYNLAIDMVNTDDWIFWADDDTFFSDEYLANVYNNVNCTNGSIIAGIVYTQIGTSMSPFERGIWPQACKDIVGKKINNVVCINSGLCIKKKMYDIIGKYNENQFMDMLDYWLFDELKKKNLDDVFIVDGIVRQNFSAYKKIPQEKLMNRYKIFRNDFIAYCHAENKNVFYKYFVLAKRRFNIFLKSINSALCKS